MSNSPAFQFYPADLISDPEVMFWDMESLGCYWQMLNYLWLNNGHCEENVDKFRILFRKNHKKTSIKCWENIKSKFIITDGVISHKRINKEMQKQAAYRLMKQKAGKKGASKRWGDDGTTINLPLAEDSSSSSSSSSSPSSSFIPGAHSQYYTSIPQTIDLSGKARKSPEKHVEASATLSNGSVTVTKPPDDSKIEDFEVARKLYPGTKRGKNTEFVNYKKKHKDWAEVVQLLKLAVATQIQWREDANGDFRPAWKNFSTWINNRCWEEVPTKPGVNHDRRPIQSQKQTTHGQAGQSTRTPISSQDFGESISTTD